MLNYCKRCSTILCWNTFDIEIENVGQKGGQISRSHEVIRFIHALIFLLEILRLERTQICFRENPKRTLDFLAPQIGVGVGLISSLPEAEKEPNLSIGMGNG
jgi:hypothetical protein